MNIDKLEIWVHDHILKNDVIRHAVYGMYQRALYIVSPKIKCEGNISKITPDDNYEYFFGYYDKCPWSDDGRYILALRVKNSVLEPDSTKQAEIVRIELKTKNVEALAITHSWNVQQGCMVQWISNNEILYNDFRDGRYCAVILDLNSRDERIIGMPIYAVSKDRLTALSLDFSRLHRLRPGYGYGNIPEVTKDEKCPNSTCIWRINILTGEIIPFLKYSDFASFEQKENMIGAEHKVNHLMISPNGERFMVLHRWFFNGVKYTRLITCNMDGSEMYNLSDDDFVSHCCWKNNEEILAYLNKSNDGKGYFLMRDKSQEYKRMWPELAVDGHPTYSYDGEFVITDTYPNRFRIQSIYLMHGDNVHRVARVFSPFRYSGDVRCDLHPRWSVDGTRICFDGSFEGKRGIYSLKVPNVLQPKCGVETKKPNVTILMATYNGEKYLQEQIESLSRQKGVKPSILVRDDGSTDKTLDILNDYQSRGILQWYTGKHLNVQKGFLDLIKNAPESDYYAFCDQDDVWDDDKLICAINQLEQFPCNKPALYYCGLRIVNSELQVIKTHYINDNRSPEANFYISNIAGCTAVFNKSLKDIVKLGNPDFILMHDSWVYKVCLSVGGNIYIDKYAHINYRQHDSNVVGIRGGISNKLYNAKRYFNEFKIQKQVSNLYDCYRSMMIPHYLELTNIFCEYKESPKKWWKLLKYDQFRFDSVGLTAIAYLKIIFRKV